MTNQSRWLLLVVAFSLPCAVAQSWSQLTPSGGPPPPRGGHVAVFDPATSQMIIFGGTASGVNRNDAWALNLATNHWSPLAPSGTLPPARNRFTAVYDSVNSRMTIFGGGLGQSAPCANDVWVLAGANGPSPSWSQLTPIGGPPVPRTAH